MPLYSTVLPLFGLLLHVTHGLCGLYKHTISDVGDDVLYASTEWIFSPKYSLAANTTTTSDKTSTSTCSGSNLAQTRVAVILNEVDLNFYPKASFLATLLMDSSIPVVVVTGIGLCPTITLAQCIQTTILDSSTRTPSQSTSSLTAPIMTSTSTPSTSRLSVTPFLTTSPLPLTLTGTEKDTPPETTKSRSTSTYTITTTLTTPCSHSTGAPDADADAGDVMTAAIFPLSATAQGI
ncbi:hypothetical protein HD806DRAFT_543283 [Xylariaceae sp. AK1471]|nr:hypothetical protein HD806DRAFT_543283 [Xylariaceae sp. AK1471]